MKNNPNGITLPRPYPADAMAQVHPIRATRPLHGPVVNGKDNRVALTKWHHHRSTLHSRTLFSHNKLAPGKVSAGVRQQNGQLKREDMLAIKVLVQAVVIVHTVLKNKRRWPRLTGVMAPLNEIGVRLRIAHLNFHRFIPAIGDRNQMRIRRRPELAQKTRSGYLKYLYSPRPNPCRPITTRLRKTSSFEYRPAISPQLFNHSIALLVQITSNPLPVESINSLADGPNHAPASLSSRARFRSTPHR